MPDSFESEFDVWKSFLDFMKGGGDIIVIKDNEIVNPAVSILYNRLTTGRKGTSFSFGKLPQNHKNKYPSNITNDSIIFHEVIENQIHELSKKNKLVLGCQNIYLNQWSKLICNSFESPLIFRKKKCNFKSWEFLKKLVPFSSDIIFSDRFILEDKSLIESNFFEILKNIQGNYEGKRNLILITGFNNHTNITMKGIFEDLKVSLNSNGLNYNLSLVFNRSKEWKEHDRNIITNHIRLKSGDSFNYFLSNGELATKGTELDFYPLVTFSRLDSTKTILQEVEEIIKVNPIENKFGEFNNDLLKYIS